MNDGYTKFREEGLLSESFDVNKRAEFVEVAGQSNASLEYYLHFTGLTIEKMKGKKILDIGGLFQGDFSKAAKQNGVDIVTLNPSYSIPNAEGELVFVDPGDLVDPKLNENSVLAYAQSMPFADSAFDYELAHLSVPIYLPNYVSEYCAMFNEVLRTLKSRGEAYFAPIFSDILESEGFKVLLGELEINCKVRLQGLSNTTFDGKKVGVFGMAIRKP